MPLLHASLLPAAVGVLAAAAAYARVPEAARHRVWAEDGREFLTDALAGRGPLTPYDGYLHLVPRLLAEMVARTLDLGRYDVGVTVAACAAVGLVCALTYVLTDDLLGSRSLRVLVSLTPAFLPSMGGEALGNLANLHTFGLWLAFWIVLHRPRTRTAAAAWAVAALLVGLSEIGVVLLLPLFALGWRDPLRWAPRLALAAGGAAQVVTSVVAPRPVRDPGAAWSLPDVLSGLLGQGGVAWWRSDAAATGELVRVLGAGGVLVLAIVPLAAYAVVLVWGSGDQRWLATAAGLVAGLVWCAGAVANHYAWMDFASWTPDLWRDRPLLRYAATSGLFVVVLLACAADVLARRGRAGRWLGSATVAVVALAAVAGFHPARVAGIGGEPWPDQASMVGRCGDGRAALRIETAPAIDPPRWVARVPCSAVAGEGLG